ncbi:hypothetical protein [Kordiimonas sp.]|uniref:hypothetical protein n=1 Tax=Kordiimonas sp. TaxID=1970157 RepID=UPI003A8E9FE4
MGQVKHHSSDGTEDSKRVGVGAAVAVGAGLGTALSVGLARYMGDWATGYAIGMPVGIGLSLFIYLLFTRRSQ